MSNDFYLDAANKRALELDADANEMTAGLARARAQDDEYTARQLIQGLANCQSERRNLNATVSEYINAANPPQQERESIFASNRLPKDGNDALEIMNYNKKPGDKTYVTPDEYNRQQRELYRRKAMGDYHGKP